MVKKRSVFFGSDIFRNSVYGSNHPLNIARVWPVVDLCKAEGWLVDDDYISIPVASIAELSRYHDPDYVKALFQAEQNQALPDELRNKYHIGKGANPIFKEVYSRPATAAKASIMAAEWLAMNKADIIFSPSGGTHHGQKNKANGFCFVNDPVCGLLTLRQFTDKRILYFDIDAHHCDGVQDWLSEDDDLRIISIHQDDLWPRTGGESDRGGGNARNFLLPKGANDDDLSALLNGVVRDEINRFSPDYIIMQAGADGHVSDPQSKLSYSLNGYWQAIEFIISFDKPSLFLGGGGYNPYITAKAWSGIWALIKGISPYEKTLSEASQKLLMGLDWQHRLARNAPSHWFTELGDPA